MSVNRMRTGSPKGTPQTAPKNGNGGVSGIQQNLFDLDVNKSISGNIDDLYAAMQKAVEAFGGVVALAASMERPVPGVSLRVRHERDSKGDVQNATLDMLGHLVADHSVRAVFLHALCDAWGFKHPEKKADPTLDEKYRALRAVLRGELGEEILERAAEVGGFDANAFHR